MNFLYTIGQLSEAFRCLKAKESEIWETNFLLSC